MVKFKIVFGNKKGKESEEKNINNKPSLSQKIVAWICLVYVIFAIFINIFTTSASFFIKELFTSGINGFISLVILIFLCYSFTRIIIQKKKLNKVLISITITVITLAVLGIVLVLWATNYVS